MINDLLISGLFGLFCVRLVVSVLKSSFSRCECKGICCFDGVRMCELLSMDLVIFGMMKRNCECLLLCYLKCCLLFVC